MKDIKMSEVFGRLPIAVERFWLLPDERVDIKEIQAMVYAINNHDRLVVENKKLRQMLEMFTEALDQRDGCGLLSSKTLYEAKELLDLT